MEKEKWIDDILEKGKRVSPASSNPYLATRVMAKLHEKVPYTWSLATISALLLLVILNVTAFQSTSMNNTRQDELQRLSSEYGWESADLYLSKNFK